MDISVNGLVNGMMVYWEEVPDAARYYVHLIVSGLHGFTKRVNGVLQSTGRELDYEIALVEVERNKKYYTFRDLARIDKTFHKNADGTWYVGDAKKDYYVFVEAENKNGGIIDRSDRVKGIVLDYYIYKYNQ